MGLLDSLRKTDEDYQKETTYVGVGKFKAQSKEKNILDKESNDIAKKQTRDKIKWAAFVIGFIFSYSYTKEVYGTQTVFTIGNLAFGFIFWVTAEGILGRKNSKKIGGALFIIIGLLINWVLTAYLPNIAINLATFGIFLIGAGITFIEWEEYKERKKNVNRFFPIIAIVLFWLYVILVTFIIVNMPTSSVFTASEDIKFKNLDSNMYYDDLNNCVFEITFIAYNVGNDASNVVAHSWIVNDYVEKSIGNILKGGEVSVNLSKTFSTSICNENQPYYEPWFTSS